MRKGSVDANMLMFGVFNVMCVSMLAFANLFQQLSLRLQSCTTSVGVISVCTRSAFSTAGNPTVTHMWKWVLLLLNPKKEKACMFLAQRLLLQGWTEYRPTHYRSRYSAFFRLSVFSWCRIGDKINKFVLMQHVTSDSRTMLNNLNLKSN